MAAVLVIMMAGVAMMLAKRYVTGARPEQPPSAALSVTPGSTPDNRQPDAYAKYTKAEFFANMRTPASMAKAIDLLNEVILIDPQYGRAYAALAECYGLQGFYHFKPPAEAYPRAKDAAYRALALDNSLAQAHVALLGALTDYDWDWEGAEREYKAAIAIDPNYAVAYQYFGYALMGAGRGREALVVMKRPR
jgi:tetratricopeptide (TPR) repeat protein